MLRGKLVLLREQSLKVRKGTGLRKMLLLTMGRLNALFERILVLYKVEEKMIVLTSVRLVLWILNVSSILVRLGEGE
jgi:hypothetical protein